MKTIITTVFAIIVCTSAYSAEGDVRLIPDAINILLSDIVPGMTKDEILTVAQKRFPQAELRHGVWSGQTGYYDYILTPRYRLSISFVTTAKRKTIMHGNHFLYVIDGDLKRRVGIQVYDWEQQRDHTPTAWLGAEEPNSKEGQQIGAP